MLYNSLQFEWQFLKIKKEVNSPTHTLFTVCLQCMCFHWITNTELFWIFDNFINFVRRGYVNCVSVSQNKDTHILLLVKLCTVLAPTGSELLLVLLLGPQILPHPFLFLNLRWFKMNALNVSPYLNYIEYYSAYTHLYKLKKIFYSHPHSTRSFAITCARPPTDSSLKTTFYYALIGD